MAIVAALLRSARMCGITLKVRPNQTKTSRTMPATPTVAP